MTTTFGFTDVTAVLLADGQWHDVADNSFSTTRCCSEGMYDGGGVIHFIEADGTGVYGPLSSALALRHS